MIRLFCTITAVSLLSSSVVFPEEPMGVTYRDGLAEIRVWAPNAHTVSIVGDFNSWKPTRDDELSKDAASGVWSGSLRGSRARGAYAFLINGELLRRDPYGRAVTPQGDQSVFYEPDTFDWSRDRAPDIALEDTIIYEMHVGTFYDPRPGDGEPATFDDVASKLNYLVDLGVNTLCLLPVHEFHGKHSWGYNPSDPFAVEQAYGGPDALKRLISACHKRGIAVHLDVVHNHYGPENLDLIMFDGTGNQMAGGIYFYSKGGKALTPWGPRVKFSDPMVRRYVRDNIIMWLEEYRIDGFRWDSTVNIRAYNNGSVPIPEGAEMLEDINGMIRSKYPGRWSIAEDSYGIGSFDASWQYEFHHLVMPVLQAKQDEHRDMYQLRSALNGQQNMLRVMYVDNHDEAGRLNGQRRIATDIDPYEPGSFYAKKMSGLGALLTLTAPGIPLLFMGNEFQEYGAFHDDNPLDWSKTRLHGDLLRLHRELIALRLNKAGATGGLKGRGIEVPLIDNKKNGIVYWRWNETTSADIVVIAANFSADPQELSVPFPSADAWQMRLDTDWARFGGANRVETSSPFTPDDGENKRLVTLPGYSARIYSLANRPPRGAKRPEARRASARKSNADRPALSMYASMHLIGNFNGWEKTAWPFKLAEDYTWEGEFVFDGVQNPSFKISANANGVINWGGFDGALEIAENGSTQLKRLGKAFTSSATWNGRYRMRFNEDLLFLNVEKLETPQPVNTPAAIDRDADETPDGFRIWTDARGATVTAKLISAAGVMVSLEREDGTRIQLPAGRFSNEDRAYIQDWIDEFGD